MASSKKFKIAVVVLNWNGEEDSLNCIAALKKQSQSHTIIAVDNASSDGFVSRVKKDHPDIILLENNKNLGFAGGVNTGIRYALKNNFDFVALINNDALPEKDWLEHLLQPLAVQGSSLSDNVGIVTGKLLKTDGTIDSTGDQYTTWGLAYPRGRDERDVGQYDKEEFVFAATGGASLYRCEMLREIGLFDEDFFAYYEDVDLSFRAQLAGWKVLYTPKAIAHHKVGASSSKIPGFTTYVTVRNLPWLLWKNVPLRLLPRVWPRFFIAHSAIVLSGLSKGKIIPICRGVFMAFLLFPKKLIQRHNIQKGRKTTVSYIASILTYDLPPNAHKLSKIRNMLRKIRFWRK